MGTKTDPGEFDCHGAAADDEPVFTLRANDELAPEVVLFWVSRYLETKCRDGVAESLDDMQRCIDKAREAAHVAEAMKAWKAKQVADAADKPAAISSAELIERTDRPEVKGAVNERGGGRHT